MMNRLAVYAVELALYAVALAALMGLGWSVNYALKAHYQEPILAKLQTAETERDGWKTAAQDAETKRAELNKKLLARDVFDKTVRAKIEKVSNDLEELKNKQPEVKSWADSPIPTDVLRLRFDQTDPGTHNVQGGRSLENTGGSPGQADERRDESGYVESNAGAGRRVSDV